jgi:hypothetical protein
MHEAIVFKNISKVIEDLDHTWIQALTVLLAAPPIVFAASQYRYPPKEKT